MGGTERWKFSDFSAVVAIGNVHGSASRATTYIPVAALSSGHVYLTEQGDAPHVDLGIRRTSDTSFFVNNDGSTNNVLYAIYGVF